MLNSNLGKISKYKRKLIFINYFKYLTNKFNIKLQLIFLHSASGVFIFSIFL